jgi:hypothetical protein
MDTKLLKMTEEEYDEAIAGIACVWQKNRRVDTLIYSGEKLMEILVKQGATEEEALEHISINMEGSYVGLSTPIIMWDYDEQQSE